MFHLDIMPLLLLVPFDNKLEIGFFHRVNLYSI